MTARQPREPGPVTVPRPGDRLWSVAETAHYLGVPVGTLYQWRHRGLGPAAFKVGRHLRYDPEIVRRWLENEAA